MTAQAAPYESLTTVEAIQKAQADGRTVELNRAPRWEETNLRDEKNIAAFLRIGAEFRAALPERAPVRAGGDALSLAIRFHETYERLAPSFGYETRTETRAFDQATPNGRLMVAVCGELLAALAANKPDTRQAQAQGSEDLASWLRWVAGELVKRDTQGGTFAQGVAQSLCGRAYILEYVAHKKDAAHAQAGEGSNNA